MFAHTIKIVYWKCNRRRFCSDLHTRQQNKCDYSNSSQDQIHHFKLFNQDRARARDSVMERVYLEDTAQRASSVSPPTASQRCSTLWSLYLLKHCQGRNREGESDCMSSPSSSQKYWLSHHRGLAAHNKYSWDDGSRDREEDEEEERVVGFESKGGY